ncbi:hypothetical protein IHQ71_28430 [Rhizobium sp. TH2]|nr:hypothetical protein IHQ71_28430 [Rhizobium sp. TH2]
MLLRRLADTDDGPILSMVWAVHALQSGRAEHAQHMMLHTPVVVTNDPTSEYMVHKWELETLLTVTLNMQKDIVPVFLKMPINTSDFDSFAGVLNLLKDSEDAQSTRLTPENVMSEFHRISHRQFPWQIGWHNVANLYRHAFVYGQGLCDEYFKKTYGLSISDFMACCFVLWVQTQLAPWCAPLTKFPVDVPEDAMEKTMAMVSGELWTTRRKSFELFQTLAAGKDMPVAYHPSYLRLKPIIRAAPRNHYIAPLPELILFRATVGLYYDLFAAGTTVMNDARARFEEYARQLIKAYIPGFDPCPAEEYKYKNSEAETPDILLKRDGKIVAVFECKATKLSFQAQYADDPASEAKNQYDQIANAVFQLWRFFSHVRRGIIKQDLADEVAAVVLTMEPWTQTSSELRATMVAEAEKLAATKEPEMTAEDKRVPLFVSISEMEHMLAHSTEEDVQETFRAGAHDAKYRGWSVREIRRNAVKEVRPSQKYPFEPGDLLPWWKETEERGLAKRAAEVAAQAASELST